MVPFKKKTISYLISSLALTLSPLVLAQSAEVEGDKVAVAKAAGNIEEVKKKKTSSGSNEAVEEIVVTATRRAESVADIPFNISAMSEETLRKKNITDAKSFIEKSVAINAPANSARFNDSVTVRGLNVARSDANNLEQFVRTTLAYYLDETPLPHMVYRIKDVQRVETLLGPQGTLYGSGSLGGTVRYITNDPKIGETEFKVNTRVYNTDHSSGFSSDTDFVVNLPLGESVALRASVAHLDEKGYIDRAVNPAWRTGDRAWEGDPNPNKTLYKDDDWHESTGGKIAVLWEVNDDVSVKFSHIEQDRLAHGINGGSRESEYYLCDADDTCMENTLEQALPYQYDPYTVVSRYEEFSDRKFSLDSFDLDWDLGFAALHSSTSVFDDKNVGQADYASQGYWYYGSWISGVSLDESNNSAYMTSDNRYEGLSHETRLVSTGDGPLSWVAGIYYTEQDRAWMFSEWMPNLDDAASQIGWLGFDRAAVGGSVDEGYHEDLRSSYKELAFFGELTYALTDRWDVTAGGRVFSYDDENDAVITDYLGLSSGNRINKVSVDGEAFYKLNTSYDLTDDVMLYATASQGFRRGGANSFKEEGGQVPTQEIQFYEPDSVDNYELGMKGTFLDGRLYVAANLFHMDWRDTQTYWSQTIYMYGVPFPVNGTTNGPDSESEGLELSATYRVTDNWSLSWQSAKTEARWAETGDVCTYGLADDYEANDCYTYEKGAPLGATPEWKHIYGVDFDTELASGVGISASLSGRYVGEVQSGRADKLNADVYTRDSYSVYDGSVSAVFENYSAALWVTNLTNSDAETSGMNSGILGYRTINLRPRTMGLSLSYEF